MKNIWSFNTIANGKTFEKNFKIYVVDSICNIILLIVGMQITNWDYLENELFYFTKLLNNNIKELNKTWKILYNAAIILNNNKKYPSDLPNLDAKYRKKKEIKLENVNIKKSN